MENFIIECPECHANFYNINDSILQKCPVCKKIFNVEQLEESESLYESEDIKEEELESPYESEDIKEEESESLYESEDIKEEEESESPYESEDIKDINIPPLLAIIILLPFILFLILVVAIYFIF